MPTTASKNVTSPAPTAVVCDDDPMTRKLMTTVLEQAGYEVISRVDNAMSAIQIASISQPDVMLLDLVLPNMSGEDAIPAIRSAAPDCAIVICSAHDASTAIRNGAVLVVPKGALGELEKVLTALKVRIQKRAASR
ncbi:MAG TPA: response regulator [Acidimicrobiales bacterium]|nr:response regulator [Acidimicrobiales bacterium]